jgi:hypothetical protein
MVERAEELRGEIVALRESRTVRAGQMSLSPGHGMPPCG